MILTNENILHYIQIHATENVKLNDVASTFYISKSKVVAIVKNTTGMSFHQYITNLKLAKACQLLKETSDSVTEIAFQTGFSSSSRFSQVFNKHFSISPSQYRKSHEEKVTKVEKENIEFSTNSVSYSSPINKLGIYVGSISQFVSTSFKHQLLLALKELHTKRIFINSIYYADRSKLLNDSLSLDLRYLCEAFDFITKYNLEPIIELSLFPQTISLTDNQLIKVTAPPIITSSLTIRNRLEKILNFLYYRYSADSRKNWRFVFWYDPSKNNSPCKYAKFYKAVYKTVKSILPEPQFGAGSFNLSSNYSAFKTFCDDFIGKLPIDFITGEINYSLTNSNVNNFNDYIEVLSNKVKKYSETVNVACQRNNKTNIPFIVTKYSLSSSDRDSFNDSINKGAFLLKLLSQKYLNCSELFLYSFSDQLSSYLDTEGPLWGGNAIITRDGFPKPTYFATSLYSYVTNDKIKAGKNYVVFKINVSHFIILFYNDCDLKEKYYQEAGKFFISGSDDFYRERHVLKLSLKIKSSKKIYMTLKRINKNWGNIQNLIKHYFDNNNLSKADIDWIRRLDVPSRERKIIKPINNYINTSITLSPGSFGLLSLTIDNAVLKQ